MAESTDYISTARLPGRIKASTISEVRPQASGIIRARLFEEGSRVESGQPLYKIEDETYAAQVSAARAGVAQAKANFDLAVREAARAEDLFSTNTGSGQRRDSAIAARDAALQLAQAQLQTAEIDLERTTIRAPISGVIGLSQATPGSLVAAQQPSALTTIRTLDPVYVDVTQSANDLLNWQSAGGGQASLPAAQATMILPNNTIYPTKGELRAAEPMVEPTTGMVTLRIGFPNPDHLLLPGLYVEVELPQAEEKGVFMVPQSAVMRHGRHAAGLGRGKRQGRSARPEGPDLVGEQLGRLAGAFRGRPDHHDRLPEGRTRPPVEIVPSKPAPQADAPAAAPAAAVKGN